MNKWHRKYLKLARALAQDNSACYSRQIGSVIVSRDNTIISLGYNGSLRGIPHNDSVEYLNHLYNSLLDDNEREYLVTHGVKDADEFVNKFNNCKICPRKLLGIESGEKLYLCACGHSERNALANANRSGISTLGASIYCYCALPCHECTTQIIQSGIVKVVCLASNGSDYSPSSRKLFEMANVEIVEVDPMEIDSGM